MDSCENRTNDFCLYEWWILYIRGAAFLLTDEINKAHALSYNFITRLNDKAL